MPTEDLQDQSADATPAPAAPSKGPSEDWEARFKGLQREYNTLKNKYDGAIGSTADLQAEIISLKTQVKDVSTSTQADVSRLTAELTTATADKTRLAADLADAQNKLTIESRKAEIQTQLATDFPAQLPQLQAAMAKNFLQVGDRSGDDLKSFVADWLGFHNQGVQQQVQETVRGSSPSISLSTTGLGNASQMEIDNWIMSHDETHPEWATYYQQYLHPTSK